MKQNTVTDDSGLTNNTNEPYGRSYGFTEDNFVVTEEETFKTVDYMADLGVRLLENSVSREINENLSQDKYDAQEYWGYHNPAYTSLEYTTIVNTPLPGCHAPDLSTARPVGADQDLISSWMPNLNPNYGGFDAPVFSTQNDGSNLHAAVPPHATNDNLAPDRAGWKLNPRTTSSAIRERSKGIVDNTDELPPPDQQVG